MAEHSGFIGGRVGDNLMVQLTNDIANATSPRVLVPILHLYLDHVFDLVLQRHWDKSPSVINDRSSYLQKLYLLYARNLIPDEKYESLKAINNIRNKFAHSFDPNDQTIERQATKLTGHNYTAQRPWLDRYSASVIDSMSLLTAMIDRDQ